MCEASCYNDFCREAKRIIISKLRFDLLDFSAAEKEGRKSKTGIIESNCDKWYKGAVNIGFPRPVYTLTISRDCIIEYYSR
jgi:hypothetical protein